MNPIKINEQSFTKNRLNYIIRSAQEDDAEDLSLLRLQIDGETENLDREQGEGVIDVLGFKQIIKKDTESNKNLFLVVIAQGKIVGFSRCQGTDLKRFAHKVVFGVCVLKAFWGHGIGTNLLRTSITWADAQGIKKIILYVLESNVHAIHIYEKFGFEIEGRLRKDKLLSDGDYYDTIIMSRFQE